MNSNYDFSIIKIFRKKLGLTLEKLAELAGLTYPTVETVETNKTTPSLKTIDALVGVLQISTSQLLSYAEGRLVHVRKAEKKNTNLGIYKTAFYDDAKILRVKAEKDTYFPIIEQHENSNEFCYVLSGQMCIDVNGQLYELEKDDSVLFDGMLKHSYKMIQDSEFMAIHIPKNTHIIETLLSANQNISVT